MQKATGIIRHVDELGRIVVPKELRNTLKIKNGTSMEIYTNEKNELILKKYNHSNGVKAFADILSETMGSIYSVGVMIADNEGFISGAEDHLEDCRFNEAMYNLIVRERVCLIKESCEKYLPVKGKISELLVNPIIVQGDLYGAVIVFSEKRGVINDEIFKMSRAAANLIEGQCS